MPNNHEALRASVSETSYIKHVSHLKYLMWNWTHPGGGSNHCVNGNWKCLFWAAPRGGHNVHWQSLRHVEGCATVLAGFMCVDSSSQAPRSILFSL